ncbi:MAG TPA: hypothetical protein VHI78_12325, partial [Bacteroidales bacterium]|nr:hypothetical protein [Bacteroidales bacterium]
MKKSILFLFIMACFSLAAQESKYYAGFYFSPDICDHVIIRSGAKSINDLTIWHLRFHTGITAGYQLTKSFYFESGFQYTSKGLNSRRMHVFDGEGDPTGDEFSTRQNAG